MRRLPKHTLYIAGICLLLLASFIISNFGINQTTQTVSKAFGTSTVLSCKYGLEVGQVIDDGGNIKLLTKDLDNIVESGATCIKINFRLGNHFDDWTTKDSIGRTALMQYSRIVDMIRARNLEILGLFSNETWKGTSAEWRANSAGTGDNAYIVNFADKAAIPVMKYFSGKIKVWEVWNEPGYRTPTTFIYPSNFAWLLRRVYVGAKDAGLSGVKIISGGIACLSGAEETTDAFADTSYITQTYARGRDKAGWNDVKARFGSYPMDGIGQHIYPNFINPVGQTTTAANVQKCLDMFRNAYMASGESASKPTVVTEVGWITEKPEQHTSQAENLRIAFTEFKKKSYVNTAFWHTLHDWPGLSIGLLGTDYSQKLSYRVFQNMCKGGDGNLINPTSCPTPAGAMAAMLMSTSSTCTICPTCQAKTLLTEKMEYCYGHINGSTIKREDCDVMAQTINQLNGSCAECQSGSVTCTVCTVAPVMQSVTDWCYNKIGQAGLTSSTCESLARYTTATHEDCNARKNSGMCSTVNPTPVNMTISGRVVDSQGKGVPFVKVQVEGVGATGSVKSYYPLTDLNGNFKQGGFILRGGQYAVRIVANTTSPRTAPPGLTPPARTTAGTVSYNNCTKAQTPNGSLSYECQIAGRTGGYADCGSETGKGCNFRYDGSFVPMPTLWPTGKPIANDQTICGDYKTTRIGGRIWKQIIRSSTNAGQNFDASVGIRDIPIRIARGDGKSLTITSGYEYRYNDATGVLTKVRALSTRNPDLGFYHLCGFIYDKTNYYSDPRAIVSITAPGATVVRSPLYTLPFDSTSFIQFTKDILDINTKEGSLGYMYQVGGAGLTLSKQTFPVGCNNAAYIQPGASTTVPHRCDFLVK